MAPLQLPNGFKYKSFFFANILSVIKVDSSSEGSGGGVVYSAFECTTLEVDVGVKNVLQNVVMCITLTPWRRKKNG
jgi:hypothetical protein